MTTEITHPAPTLTIGTAPVKLEGTYYFGKCNRSKGEAGAPGDSFRVALMREGIDTGNVVLMTSHGCKAAQIRLNAANAALLKANTDLEEAETDSKVTDEVLAPLQETVAKAEAAVATETAAIKAIGDAAAKLSGSRLVNPTVEIAVRRSIKNDPKSALVPCEPNWFDEASKWYLTVQVVDADDVIKAGTNRQAHFLHKAGLN